MGSGDRRSCGFRELVEFRTGPSLGAILDHDELHDELQCAGRDLPNHLFLAAGAGGRFDNDRPGPVPGCQSDGEHVVRHGLHDDAACVSIRLFS